jgi:hypothetical protein
LTSTDPATGIALLPDTSPTISDPTLTYVGDADAANLSNPFWFVTYGSSYEAQTGGFNADGTPVATFPGQIPLEIHLKKQTAATGTDQVLLPNQPLSSSNTMPNIDNAPNARVVVNSERVYGPEQDSGPGSTGTFTAGIINPTQMQLVLYHRIAFNPGTISSIGADEYMVDYDNGIVYLGTAGNGSIPGNINIGDPSAVVPPQRRTVMVAFNWQNNAGSTTAAGVTTTTGASARASYETGSKIAVSIGIRLFDPQTAHPTYYSLTNAVIVGNAAR